MQMHIFLILLLFHTWVPLSWKCPFYSYTFRSTFTAYLLTTFLLPSFSSHVHLQHLRPMLASFDIYVHWSRSYLQRLTFIPIIWICFLSRLATHCLPSPICALISTRLSRAAPRLTFVNLGIHSLPVVEAALAPRTAAGRRATTCPGILNRATPLWASLIALVPCILVVLTGYLGVGYWQTIRIADSSRW